MGEQGLVSSQSLKAAENQATLLTNIYTGFSKTASARITEDFSKALSEVAVKTGGTVSDIQKTLATAPFLSRTLNAQQRGSILGDIQRVQTFASQAGLGNNAADVFRKIATGQTNFMELESSDDSLSKVIGARLRETAPVSDLSAVSIEERTRILQNLIKSLDVKELGELAKETGGFRVVLAKFSASLFNPKIGLFGAMREFTLSAGEAPTTIFKETTKLFESIFGEEGFIKTLGKELAKVFGVRGEDSAVKFLGRGIRFITTLIKNVTDLIDDVLNNPIIKGIANIVRSAFNGVVRFIEKLDEIAKNPPDMPDFSSENIQKFVRDFGENIRGFLKKIGATIRGENISDEAQTGSSIIGTILDEAGKTILTFFKEVGGALLSKAGTIAIELGKQVIPTIVGLFGRALSGEGGLIGQIIAGIVGIKGVGLLAGGVRSVGGGVRNLREGITNIRDPRSGGLRGALNRAAGRPFGSLSPSDYDLEGGATGFQGQMLALVRRIADCVCGGLRGAGREVDIKADTPEARRERARTGRGPTGPSMPRRAPLTSLDTANPYAYSRGAYLPEPDTRSSYLKMQREARRNAIKGTSSSRYFDLYTESLGGVSGPFSDLGPDERGLMAARNIESPEALRKQEMVRQRYNQRFSRRARLGRVARGFGKGALIAGGVTALAGLGSLISGDDAMASEFDPATGEFVQPQQPKVGAGEAFGRVGMGAAEGALTGAMFGPWGAAIGGVIGGGIALMDKGVRDAIGKSIKEFTNSVIKFGKDFTDGAGRAISNAFNSIGSLVRGVDWKGLLIRALIPGGDFTIKGLQGIADFASKLNIFDAIKAGLDKLFNPIDTIKGVVDKILSVLPGGKREAGGPVIKGTSYIVGERGPEIFTPGQSGSVLTNRELNNLASRASTSTSVGGGSNVVFNVTINATGLAGNDIAAAIQPAVIKILDDGMRQVSGNTVTRGTTII